MKINCPEEFKSMFKPSLRDHACCKILEHVIETKNAKPIVKRSYSIPCNLEDKVKKEIDKMLKEGIIQPSKSE